VNLSENVGNWMVAIVMMLKQVCSFVMRFLVVDDAEGVEIRISITNEQNCTIMIRTKTIELLSLRKVHTNTSS